MTTTTKANLAKAARVLLVFLLVFWGSFRVEAVAYAAMSKSSVKEHVEDGDKLTNITAYAVDSSADTKSGLNEKAIASTDDDQDASLSTWKSLTVDDSVKVVAVPSWNDGKPAISKNGDVEVAAFVDWKSSDKEVASVKMNDDGVATITAKGAGSATITCALNDDVGKIDTSEFPGKGKAKIRFEIKVEEPEPEPEPEPVVESKSVTVLIGDEAGTPTADAGGKLTLSKNYVGKPYQLGLTTKVTTVMSDNTDDTVTYATVSEAVAAGVAISWSASSTGDIATIDESTGAITFTSEGTAKVQVTAELESSVASESVEITVGTPGDVPTPDDPDPTPQPVSQGDSNPQDTLTVVSNARVAAATDGAGDSTGTGEAASGEAGTDASGTGGSGESGGSGDADSSGTSQPGADESAQTQTVEKTYSVSDLEALGTGRATYTMYDGGDFVTVTGEGPYLVALLHDIGIDNTDQIESLVFENADGTSTTVTWSELESANRYYPKASEGNFEDAETVSPIIALTSLVRGLGDGTGEGADAASSEAADSGDAQGSASSGASGASASSSSATAVSSDISLLDNTRFRLLFGSTSPARSIADPDALRYINKITVNVKPTQQEEDPGYNTDIGVSVEYVPVPMGAPAVFSALPNTAIRDARFDFNWEVSTDNGVTWKEVENGNVQVLRVVTTEDRIGNQYRVVMSTDASDKDGRENVTVTSDPVTMTEGNGLAVVLEYDPPIAGQTAYFQTTLYGAKSGVDIKYTWQQSQDGGQHWSDISGRTGSSLAVPTEPIDPNAEKAKDDEVVPITYVRVIAEETSGDERVAISEAVPLTVHVGDDDSGQTDVQKPTDNNENKPSTTPDPTPSKPRSQVTPIDDIKIEFSGDSDATPTVPTPDGTQRQQIDPSQLYINDEVTEKVNEQQEAVEEYIESNVPGARWTSLSSPQATDDEIRNILADNPFAPFVFPVGLGITVAGGVEKLFAFRRQVK